MDFKNLPVDTLLNSNSGHSLIASQKANLRKSVSPDNIVKEMDPSTFKLQVGKSGMEAPTKTFEVQFETGDWTFKETFIVTKLTGPIFGLTFLKNNSAILDVNQALLHFPYLKTAKKMMEHLPGNMKHQQDRDKILRNYKLPLHKEPYDENPMAKNQSALQYDARESRTLLNDGLLYRQYNGETGIVKYLQVILVNTSYTC